MIYTKGFFSIENGRVKVYKIIIIIHKKFQKTVSLFKYYYIFAANNCSS